MRIVLEIIEGFAAGRKKALRAPVVLTVGRADSADWRVSEDSAMSSRHFQISVNQQACLVTDLDSTNGTIVDGQRVASRELQDGDCIRAGATVFRVSMKQRPRPASLIAGLEKGHRDEDPAEVDRSETTASAAPPSRPAAQHAGTVAERLGSYDVNVPRTRPFTGAVVEVVSENAQGRKSILRSGQSITVGRTEQADFSIPDPSLSAVHFSISSAASGWQLIDLDSSSGTTVGGIRVTKTILKTGDRIVAGNSEFVVTVGESVPAGGVTDEAGYPFREGTRDEDPRVRKAAIEAAAWHGEPWLLDDCRVLARDEPKPEHKDALIMFCILALDSDLDLVLSLGRCEAMGPVRFEMLASHGHPAAVPLLVDAIAGDDVKSAVAAAAAFTRMTGVDIASQNRAILEAEEEDDEEFASEFADDALLPDPSKARDVWTRNAERFQSTTCLRHGLDVSGPPTIELLGQLDMKSRWEACVRARYHGRWQGHPFDLERFLIP